MTAPRLAAVAGLLLAGSPVAGPMAQIATVTPVAAAPAETTAPRGVSSIYPKDSYAVFEFAGLSECTAAAHKSKIFKLLADTHQSSGIDLNRLTGGKIQQAVEMVRYGLGEIGISASEVHAVLDGPIAIGVGRPSLHSLMTPSVLITLDTRGREARVEAFLQKLEAMLPQVIREFDELEPRWSSMKLGDAKVRRLEFERVGFRVHYATQGGFLMIATGQGYLEHALRVLEGKADGIRKHPTVAKGLAKLQGKPLMSAFINTQPIMKAIEPFTPYDVESLCDALGVGNVRGVWIGTAMTDKGSHDQFVLDLDGSPRGLLKALFSKKGTALGAEYCAPDTAIYWNMSLDTEALGESLHSLIAHLPKELREQAHREIEREVVRELDRELDDFGMSHRDLHGMLSMLTGEFSIAAKLKIDQPQVLVFAKVKDGKKAQEAISNHLGRLFTGEDLPKLRYRKSRDYWFVSVRGAPIAFTPSIAFRGNTMILSPYRQALEQALDRVDKQQASLASLAEFREARQAMKDSSWFLGLRYGQMIETVWPMAQAQIDAAILDLAEAHDMEIGDVVPDKETMSKALGSMYAAQYADREGIYSNSHDPLGIGVLGASCAWTLDWLLRSAMGKKNKNN